MEVRSKTTGEKDIWDWTAKTDKMHQCKWLQLREQDAIGEEIRLRKVQEQTLAGRQLHLCPQKQDEVWFGEILIQSCAFRCLYLCGLKPESTIGVTLLIFLLLPMQVALESQAISSKCFGGFRQWKGRGKIRKVLAWPDILSTAVFKACKLTPALCCWPQKTACLGGLPLCEHHLEDRVSLASRVWAWFVAA